MSRAELKRDIRIITFNLIIKLVVVIVVVVANSAGKFIRPRNPFLITARTKS